MQNLLVEEMSNICQIWQVSEGGGNSQKLLESLELREFNKFLSLIS